MARDHDIERVLLGFVIDALDGRPLRDRLAQTAIVAVDHQRAERVADEVTRRPAGEPVAPPLAGGAFVQVRVERGVADQDDIVTDVFARASRSTTASCSACTLAFAASTSAGFP